MLHILLEALASKFLFFALHLNSTGSFPPPLSAEEEQKCLLACANGDLSARDRLIEHNLRLVVHVIKKYYANCVDQDDLISVGTIGLIKAINTFNVGKGARLATYAARCIDNEILMNIRSGKKHQGDISLQEVIGIDREGNEVKVEDKIADDKDSIDEQVDLKIQTKKLYEVINRILKGRERTVIELRYGLKNSSDMTQREIAKLLSISRSYVSRIEKKALKKIEREMENC